MRQPPDMFCVLFLLSDVTEDAHIMGNPALSIQHPAEGHPPRIHASILAPVQQLALPVADSIDGLPHRVVKILMLSAGEKHVRILTQHFSLTETADFSEGMVDPDDIVVGIGD